MTVPFLDLKAQYDAIKPEVDRAMQSVLDQTDFIMGEDIYAFETAFAAACGRRHCVATSSGTSALELVLRAHGIGPGDEVITTPHTFIATTEAITAVGATIRWVDIDPVTYTINPLLVEAAITSHTKAILPVHLYGQPAGMDELLSIAVRHGLHVIEDAAQAHLAEYHGKTVPIGGTACFSFYPGKNLGAFGDAGCVVTDDADVADKVRRLTNHGRNQEKYEHPIEGFGHRMDTLQAAVLSTKLPHLASWTAARRQVAARYNAGLASTGLTLPAEPEAVKAVYHLYVIRTPNRDALRAHLKSQGIATGIHYPLPLHLQPAYAHLGFKRGDFPATEAAAESILSLPVYPELSASSQDAVIETIHAFFSH